MTLSFDRERCKKLLGRLIEVVTEELNIPIQSAGSTTFEREDLECGLEADDWYYIRNEPLIRAKRAVDLAIDPPPDLAVEIDISRSSLNRMGIYAAIGVPEVWRFDGVTLRVYHLTADGDYVEADHSQHFPFVPLGELANFLHQRTQMDETSLVRSFRQWVREQISRGWKASS
jgi:Uma2 family endonuclease